MGGGSWPRTWRTLILRARGRKLRFSASALAKRPSALAVAFCRGCAGEEEGGLGYQLRASV